MPIGADDAAPRRLDDGRDAFCFDPAVAPSGHEVCWQAWSPPDMPWDGAHACRLNVADPNAQVQRWRPDGGAVQQPRHTPSGAQTCVHDGTGWLNVYVGDRAVLPERIEQAGPTWGMGLRTYAVAPDERAVAVLPERTRLRPAHDRRPSTSVARLDRCRSWRPRPGLVGRRLDRGAALGRPDPDADRALRRGRRSNARSSRSAPPPDGTRSTSPSRSSSPWDTTAPSCTLAGTHAARAACSCGCTAGRRISGRSTSALASPTGGAAAGTCSWSTRGAPPATDAPISGR